MALGSEHRLSSATRPLTAFPEALGRLASKGRFQKIADDLGFPSKDQPERSLASEIRMRTIHPGEPAFPRREKLRQDRQTPRNRNQVRLRRNRSRILMQTGHAYVRKLGKTRKRRPQK